MAENQNIRTKVARRSISDIWSELKKVTWPTRKEAIRLTVLVLAISAAIGVVLSIVDYGFSELFKIVTGD